MKLFRSPSLLDGLLGGKKCSNFFTETYLDVKNHTKTWNKFVPIEWKENASRSLSTSYTFTLSPFRFDNNLKKFHFETIWVFKWTTIQFRQPWNFVLWGNVNLNNTQIVHLNLLYELTLLNATYILLNHTSHGLTEKIHLKSRYKIRIETVIYRKFLCAYCEYRKYCGDTMRESNEIPSTKVKLMRITGNNNTRWHFHQVYVLVFCTIFHQCVLCSVHFISDYSWWKCDVKAF